MARWLKAGALFVWGNMNDKRDKRQRRRDAEREADPEKKTLYEKIRAGEIEPEGPQKGWLNLQPVPVTERDPERRREICQKGAAAVNRIKGEEKTAKQSLDRMLSILATPEIIAAADIEKALADRLKRENPDMTIYDVMNAAAIGRAIAGNVKAAEYVRDTRGDAPVKQIELTENITTDADRAMLRQINERLKAGELAIVDRETIIEGTTDDDGTGNIKE